MGSSTGVGKGCPPGGAGSKVYETPEPLDKRSTPLRAAYSQESVGIRTDRFLMGIHFESSEALENNDAAMSVLCVS
jgi:hypothetical protein